MNTLWILSASLTVVGSLMYNVGVKMGGGHMNPFVFTVTLTGIALVAHLICLAVYKFAFSQDIRLQYDTAGLWYAALAGIGVVVIDLFYFLAVREGGAIPSQMIWTVGGTLALLVFALLFFHESLTLSKGVGIVLGLISLFLIIRD